MDTIKMSEKINRDRRRFFGTAAMTIAAAQFALSGSADAQPSKTKLADMSKIKPGTHTSFGALKQIDAGLLNVGYAEAGPADGAAVMLLHGWPYDRAAGDVSRMQGQVDHWRQRRLPGVRRHRPGDADGRADEVQHPVPALQRHGQSAECVHNLRRRGRGEIGRAHV